MGPLPCIPNLLKRSRGWNFAMTPPISIPRGSKNERLVHQPLAPRVPLLGRKSRQRAPAAEKVCEMLFGDSLAGFLPFETRLRPGQSRNSLFYFDRAAKRRCLVDDDTVCLLILALVEPREHMCFLTLFPSSGYLQVGRPIAIFLCALHLTPSVLRL